MKTVCLLIGLLVVPAMVYNEKSIELNGIVVDAVEGIPLSDSHVYIIGTHIGVVTGEEGEFSLKIPLIYRNKPLVVSYVGYKSYEEKVSVVDAGTLRIALEPAVVTLHEIVVMPGKELLVDKAIDRVLEEYSDQEEMLIDFYAALLFMDQDHHILDKVLKDWPKEIY